jgi:hypothetical protein
MGKNWIAPMRFTGYIQAGLPVVIGPPWGLCVDLVQRFTAGIVLDSDDDDAFMDALTRADFGTLRAGVARLHAHMLASNRAVLAPIKSVLDTFASPHTG